MSRVRRRSGGYSLVEVVVALVLVQVGLLGAAGLVVTAARALHRATRTDRALVWGEAVADSLLAHGWRGPGERRHASMVVRWSDADGGAVVDVLDSGGVPILRLPVPPRDP